jgi:hypothetical protein
MCTKQIIGEGTEKQKKAKRKREWWMSGRRRKTCKAAGDMRAARIASIFIIDITTPQYYNYFSLPFSLPR